ncbi:MAG: hypothetical protein HC934_12945 [Acaryochloridaceae cyanobacterium SU_2_1]|nr:hypothetical protein [Acaryochloridaceae cyanobacterium SU_2_1]
MSTASPKESRELEAVVDVEVVSDREYQQTLAQHRQTAEQDKRARSRAQQILQRYENGFTPNLVQDIRLSAFDSLTVSRAILQLLRLSLAEDHNCAVGEQRFTYLREPNRAIAQRCGQILYHLGGIRLMHHVIDRLIPAFDQANLSQAWQGIGNWPVSAIKPKARGQSD